MAEYLGYEFVDAAEVIAFDENGRLDGAKTDKMLGERMNQCDRAVVPGFYGAIAGWFCEDLLQRRIGYYRLPGGKGRSRGSL